MNPNTEDFLLSEEENIKMSFTLRCKEYFFLFIVLLMGFSGMSLCIEKFYPSTKGEIKDVIIHDADYVHLEDQASVS